MSSLSNDHHQDERVLVIPSAEFDRLGRFQGFSYEAERYLGTLLTPRFAQFRPRSEVEDDPGFKQIIPYVVFCSGVSVFCYTRGESQGDERLHRLRSIGVGGHVSESDSRGYTTKGAYDLAVIREINEEVNVMSIGTILCMGLINDDSTPVGQVHLGVVHLYKLDQPFVTPREDGLAEAGFVQIADLRGKSEQFETWSQICIDNFFGI